jgi:mono/diheme cytochrome c family protein
MRSTMSKHQILSVALSIGALSCVSASRAADPPKGGWDEAWKEKGYKYQNSSACSQCHTVPTGNQVPKDDPHGPQALNIVLMTEYSIWKTYDKHAQAYAVLEGPRGKMIGKLLGESSGKDVDVTKKEAGCLNCHAMSSYAGSADEGGLDLKDGVSCGGCHGPSTGWLADHTLPAWRKKTSEQKSERGLRDLRDPVVRSQLCMSCHIGNALEGKVVTHAMFAAGHPPLPPIEIATFSRNEPQHWRDAFAVPYFKNASADVVRNYHLEDMDFQRTKFALIGGSVALRETMKLAGDRANFEEKNPATVWPELLTPAGDAAPGDLHKQAQIRWPEIAMAHSDCYACHHDLRYPGYRQQRGFGYQLPGRPPVRTIPGRPLVRLWPTSLLDPAVAFSGKTADLDTLQRDLETLARSCDARPFGTPEGVRQGTGDLIGWSDNLNTQLKGSSFTRDSVLKLMHNVCALYEPKPDRSGPTLIPDYESAKQVASLLQVAYDDWRRAEKPQDDKPALDALKALTAQLNLAPYTKRDSRLDIVFQIVRKASGGSELRGKEEFQNYLKSKDVGNVETIKKLIQAQEFLNAVRAISNDDFNNGLVKDHINELQKLSDEEEVGTLQAIAGYDPETFRELLRQFASALPPAK